MEVAGRGFPDAPMVLCCLWGATTPARQTTVRLLPHFGRESIHGQEQPQPDALPEAVHPVGLDRVIFQVLRPLVPVGTADEGKTELVHQK